MNQIFMFSNCFLSDIHKDRKIRKMSLNRLKRFFICLINCRNNCIVSFSRENSDICNYPLKTFWNINYVPEVETNPFKKWSSSCISISNIAKSQ